MPRRSKAAIAAAAALAAASAEGTEKDVTAATAAAAPNGLTEGELRFIKAVFDNMTQKPDANWDNVATDLGLKDAKCAKERFRQMSVRHGWRDNTSAAPSPRKAGAAAEGKVTKRNGGTPRTPTKRTFKSAAVVKDEDEDEDDEKHGEAGRKGEVADDGEI